MLKRSALPRLNHTLFVLSTGAWFVFLQACKYFNDVPKKESIFVELVEQVEYSMLSWAEKIAMKGFHEVCSL